MGKLIEEVVFIFFRFIQEFHSIFAGKEAVMLVLMLCVLKMTQ